MADPLHLTHPLQSRLRPLAHLPAGCLVTANPFLTMTSVRFRPEDAVVEAVAGVIGVKPPTTPNRWARSNGATVIWLGPDEWLVISGLDRLDTQEAELRSAVIGHGGAAVDVSGQRIRLTLTGPHVRDVLAKGCALDLHRRIFPPGRCAQTTLGRTGVILLADDDPDTFTLLVRQSFANYLVDWLVDATEEYREFRELGDR
jgi:sarcosine oxidase subunit gamma